MVPRIALVIPVFNEEAMLPHSLPVFLEALDNLKKSGTVKQDSYVLLVDDGSTDCTWRCIVDTHLVREEVHGIRFSRNFGQQNALYAGLMKVRKNCDAAVTFDADLQDDLSILPAMMEEYRKGSEIVFGVRSDRRADPPVKKYLSEWYYRILKRVNPRTIPGHADCRLMSCKVMDVLADCRTRELYLRGMTADMGFRTSTVMYRRKKRTHGRSRYTAVKMVQLAMTGVMQSEETAKTISLAPLLGLLAVPAAVCRKASPLTCLSVALQGAVLGISASILREVRHAPRYIISDTL